MWADAPRLAQRGGSARLLLTPLASPVRLAVPSAAYCGLGAALLLAPLASPVRMAVPSVATCGLGAALLLALHASPTPSCDEGLHPLSTPRHLRALVLVDFGLARAHPRRRRQAFGSVSESSITDLVRKRTCDPQPSIGKQSGES